AGGILSHASNGPEPPGQHDRLARSALRSTRLRQADRLRISQGQAGLWAGTDRSTDQSEYRDFPATHAVEPDGIAGDPRQPARDPDRKLDPLCVAALFARGARPPAGVEAGDRGLWRARGDEGDAVRGPLRAVHRRRPPAGLTPRDDRSVARRGCTGT